MLFDPFKRREFITLLGGAITARPFAASAQQVQTKRPNIAMLIGSAPEVGSRYRDAFLQGMREFAYSEGQSFELMIRYAEARQDRYLPLAEELVRLNPDVIVTASASVTAVVRQATTTVPIVCAALVDPVASGWIENFARPGGQVTGLLWDVDTLPGKQLGLALEVVPGAKRIGVFNRASIRPLEHEIEIAATALGVQLVPAEVRAPTDLDAAFQTFTRARVDLLLMVGGPLVLSEHKRIVAFAASARLPALYAYREIVEAGGLMSYGIPLRESVRRTAFFVDRILRGTKPGELPVELPTKFELVINLETAKTLGLTITPGFQLLADEVLE